MTTKINLIFILFVLFGCTRIHTLNLETQNYSIAPREIIWFQVAGLSEEHLAMLRFSYENTEKKTSFEKMPCLGKMWSYNYFDIRPNARSSFLTQMTGKKDIKNTCEDYKNVPFWKYFGKSDYQVGMIENGATKEESFEQAWSCGEDYRNFSENVTLWKMGKAEDPKASYFHYQSGIPLEKSVFYDRSCQEQSCYSTLTENTKAIYERFKNFPNKILIIRDFTFRNLITKKSILEAKDYLNELEKLIGFFLKTQELRSDLFILVSSGETLPIELPAKGISWMNFEKNGKNVLFKRSALMSPVFASGPGAQNYCGVFEQAELVKRLLWEPDLRKLKFDLF